MKPLQILIACKNWLIRHPRWVAGLVLLILPVLTLFGVETIHRQSLSDMLRWVRYWPFEASLCLLLVFLFGALFYAAIGSMPAGFGLAGLILLLSAFVSQYKVSLLREPLLPWDLFLSKQGADLIPYVYRGLGWVNILTVLVFVGTVAFLWKSLSKIRIRLPYRLLYGGIALSVFTALAYQPYPILSTLYGMGIKNYVFEQDVNFRNNGFALGFAMNVGKVVIREPDGYGEETVSAALATVAMLDPDMQAARAVENPNVIFIMSEAFWDPTRLPNVKFSRDPMPNLRALMKKHTSGWLYTPQFGGDTANVEFEVLTGHSMTFLPGGSVAYQQYVHGPMPTLASLYREQGYETVALHTYDKWFWKRDQVYPYFGFERFIGLEDYANPAYNGEFVSDNEITQSISQLAKETDRPLFLYTVTMQNHGPYTKPRYENTIKVEGNVSEESRSILETYAQGISDSDVELKALLDQLEKLKEPTMLVFFGDHMPVLGEAYQETGYFDDPMAIATEAYTRQYTTPLLVWSNYGEKRQELPGINASFLGAKVVSLTSPKSTPYLDFVNQVSAQAPVLRNEMVMEADGTVHEGVPESMKDLMHQYEILQYDMMFGKHYSLPQP